MRCINCNKEYKAFNEDAGTYKESFCSEKCEETHDSVKKYATDKEEEETWDVYLAFLEE